MSSATCAPPLCLERVWAWDNLLLAARKAARGKRGRAAAATFEHGLADHLLTLADDIAGGRYRPGPCTHFVIREPKRRLISAAAFRDRVVHHALCNVIEPEFERRFLPVSFANRIGKGSHRAIDALQSFARRYRYVLRLDVVQFFPAIDHALLEAALARVIADPGLLALAQRIIASGAGVLDAEYRMVFFEGDDLLAACRPRGLPIGNLTSQFWANCYLHALDVFVARELGCPAYLRYVDDMALFGDSRRELYAWKGAIVERLARMRLTLHGRAAQVLPVRHGIPWLGFVVYPGARRVKARKVRSTTAHLGARFEDWRAGRISFAEFDASVQGWIAHVRHADSEGLRRHVLEGFVW